MTISVEDAFSKVLATGARMEVDPGAFHQRGVLAQAVCADRPHPPFDRVAMDGIALRHVDLESGAFREQAFAPAGAPAIPLDSAKNACVRVATGAVLPPGADTVVPVEWLRGEGDGIWHVEKFPPRGSNIHVRGADLAEGSSVMEPGIRLGPCEAGALATFGIVAPKLFGKPRIALVCTGDEIVPPRCVPPPHGIRASHPACLGAALAAAGFPLELEILVTDTAGELSRSLSGLDGFDVVLCTGGVSVGERDLVPECLEEVGFARVFHGVRMKPGKPLWFGVDSRGRTAFGLPGNPVSALVALMRFVLPHLRRRSGDRCPDPFLRLPMKSVSPDLSRTRFLPCRLVDTPEGAIVQPVRSSGSGDLPGLVGTDGFVEIPPGEVPGAVVFRSWI